MSGKKYINISVVAVNRKEGEAEFLFRVSLDNGDVFECIAKSSGIHSADIKLVKGDCEEGLWDHLEQIIIDVIELDGDFLYMEGIEQLKFRITGYKGFLGKEETYLS